MLLNFSRKIFIILFPLLTSWVCVNAQNTVIYECGFENATDLAEWQMVRQNTETHNQWMINTAISRLGTKSMYVTSDNGLTSSYDHYTRAGIYNGSIIVAYRQFTLTGGTYDISFDWFAAGETPSRDALRVGFIPSSIPVVGANTGANFPSYLSNIGAIAVLNKTNDSTFVDGVMWENNRQTITIPAGTYNLAFVWKTNNNAITNNPGACIDNIQLAKHLDLNECNALPDNITKTTTNTSITLNWQGQASSYNLRYFREGVPNPTITTISGITTNSYTFSRTSLPEGVYTFQLKSICSNDSSIWTQSDASSNVLVYDPASYCLDFLDFNASGVSPSYGSYANKHLFSGTIDLGFQSKESRQTVHYLQNEYDKITKTPTGLMLKTVPNGALAAVRLGNSLSGANQGGEALTYSFYVDSATSVLQLNYAVVFGDAAHSVTEQPEFVLRILDQSGNEISSCSNAHFYADMNAAGWHVSDVYENFDGEDRRCVWKDWTKAGVNLKDYVGQNIKVELSTNDCAFEYSPHFGYAYFTLGCSSGNITGVSCGEHPESFVVDEGFLYKWYKKENASTKMPVVGNTNVLQIAPNDTATYCVDLIHLEDPNCFFTLEASALPRLPLARAEFVLAPENCENKVNIVNKSGVFGFWNGAEIPTNERLESYFWDFGQYGTSTDANPTNLNTVSNLGDTIDVILRVTMGNGGCENVDTFKVIVPPIGNTIKNNEAYIHSSQLPYTFDNRIYTQAGFYTDTLQSVSGCDSIFNFNLKVLDTKNIDADTTICSGNFYILNGDTLTTSGFYSDTIKSVVLPYDSLIYNVNLNFNQNLSINFDSDAFWACSGDPSLLLNYYVSNGQVSNYRIEYGSDGINAGLQNYSGTVTNPLTIPLTDTRAGLFDAKLIFLDACGNKEFPLSLEIRYPDSIITQRWNDVLAVRNRNYNGGYEFERFQWFKNDIEIPGATKSYLYVPEGLDFTANYTVNLVQAGQDKWVMSCGFTPVYTTGNIMLYPTSVRKASILFVNAPTKGKASAFSLTGQELKSYVLVEGKNQIEAPSEAGIYIYRLFFEDGQERVFKISVIE